MYISGVTGGGTPVTQVMDVVFERKKYMHDISAQQKELMTVCPPQWKSFFTALSKVSLPDYVRQSSDGELKGLFARVREQFKLFETCVGRHSVRGCVPPAYANLLYSEEGFHLKGY
jgi:hypothetical protein